MQRGRRALQEAVTQVGAGGGEVLRRDGLDHVEVVRQHVRVRRGELLVDPELDAGNLRLLAGEGVVPLDLDLGVVLPGALHLERTLTDRRLLEALGQLAGSAERGLRQRVEGGVAEHRLELAVRLRERDGEGQVVDLLQPAERLGLRVLTLQVVVAGDLLEEVAGVLPVRRVRAVVPGVDVVVGGHLLAVVEGVAVLELDRPGGVVLGRDRLGGHLVRLVGLVVVDKRAEQGGEHLGAARLVGVGRHQVLRLGDLDPHGRVGVALAGSAVAARAAGHQAQGHREREGGPGGKPTNTHLASSSPLRCAVGPGIG